MNLAHPPSVRRTGRPDTQYGSSNAAVAISAIRANEMFSSWPVVAFVAGVKMGPGSRSESRSPAGRRTPQTAPVLP